MTKVILARLVVLLCCISFQACTSTSLIYPAKTESLNFSLIKEIKVGDNLDILLKGEKDPIKLKVTEISPTEIKGENGVSVSLEKVERIEERHYSWIKNTFVVLGLALVWGIVDVKNTVDDIDLCNPTCGTP
jgi:hypothetical protein